MAVRFNLDWMNKEEYKDLLLSEHSDNTKARCKFCKLSYLISSGIAAYFRELLLSDLKQTSCFVVSCDESFNHELQKDQTDFTVRYFKNDKVESRYLTSLLLGHTTAKDLKKKFEEATEQLDIKKMLPSIYGWT